MHVSFDLAQSAAQTGDGGVELNGQWAGRSDSLFASDFSAAATHASARVTTTIHFDMCFLL